MSGDSKGQGARRGSGGVTLSAASTAAPAPNSAFTTSRCPREDARRNGVEPYCSRSGKQPVNSTGLGRHVRIGLVTTDQQYSHVLTALLVLACAKGAHQMPRQHLPSNTSTLQQRCPTSKAPPSTPSTMPNRVHPSSCARAHQVPCMCLAASTLQHNVARRVSIRGDEQGRGDSPAPRPHL